MTHDHGTYVSQLRTTSWWTRRCRRCGAVVLTWKARALVGALALTVVAFALRVI